MNFDAQTIGLFVATFVASAVTWNYFTGRKYNYPPSPPKWPIIGNLPLMASKGGKRFHYLCADLAKQYGPIFTLNIGPLPFVIVTGYEAVKECLTNCPDLNFRPTFMYTTQINRKREAGVVFCNGDLWKQTRRFGLTVLRDLGFGRKFIEAKITHEFDYVRDEISSFGGRAFDINNLLNRATCNVISIFCFGHRFDYHDDKFTHLMTMLNEGFRTSQGGARELGNFWRIFRFLPLTKTTKKMARNFSDTHDWIKNEIELQRATFSADNKSNLVDLYLMYEKGLIDDSEKPETKLEAYDLQFLISDLFIAGTETSSSTLLWGLLYMIAYPEAQKKCHEELDSVIGERVIVYGDKQNLPYVDATLSEIMRIATITAFTVPHASLNETKLLDFDIPKHAFIHVMLRSVHMDERFFPEPNEFKPERFLDEKGAYKKSPYLIQFGMGPRTCMGENLARMELFMFFAMMLQRFRFEKESSEVEINLEGHMGMTVTPQPFKLRAFAR